MRKRRIKKAAKKLDAEVKAIVWPGRFGGPTVRITARERKAARLQPAILCRTSKQKLVEGSPHGTNKIQRISC
jgi:hypothetical protein